MFRSPRVPPPLQFQPDTDPDRIAPPWRGLCTLLHLSTLSAVVIPFANLVIPLVIWLLKKSDAPEIDRCGREVLNFNLTMVPLVLAGVFFKFWAMVNMQWLIGVAVLLSILLYGLIVIIIAAVRANDGVLYRYPIVVRLL